MTDRSRLNRVGGGSHPGKKSENTRNSVPIWQKKQNFPTAYFLHEESNNRASFQTSFAKTDSSSSTTNSEIEISSQKVTNLDFLRPDLMSTQSVPLTCEPSNERQTEATRSASEIHSTQTRKISVTSPSVRSRSGSSYNQKQECIPELLEQLPLPLTQRIRNSRKQCYDADSYILEEDPPQHLEKIFNGQFSFLSNPPCPSAKVTKPSVGIQVCLSPPPPSAILDSDFIFTQTVQMPCVPCNIQTAATATASENRSTQTCKKIGSEQILEQVSLEGDGIGNLDLGPAETFDSYDSSKDYGSDGRGIKENVESCSMKTSYIYRGGIALKDIKGGMKTKVVPCSTQTSCSYRVDKDFTSNEGDKKKNVVPCSVQTDDSYDGVKRIEQNIEPYLAKQNINYGGAIGFRRAGSGMIDNLVLQSIKNDSGRGFGILGSGNEKLRPGVVKNYNYKDGINYKGGAGDMNDNEIPSCRNGRGFGVGRSVASSYKERVVPSHLITYNAHGDCVGDIKNDGMPIDSSDLKGGGVGDKIKIGEGICKKTLITWTSGKTYLICAGCKKKVQPLIKKQQKKSAFSSNGVSLTSCWPFCFLFPPQNKCTVYLYCPNCNLKLAWYDGSSRKYKTVKGNVLG